MGIFSFLKKKDPRVEFTKTLEEFSPPDSAYNMVDLFPKFDLPLMMEIVHSHPDRNKFSGIFIGTKGWYLPESEKRFDDVFESLKVSELDLNDIVQQWGLNSKRIYMGLEKEAEKRKINAPYFIRKENLLFLRSYVEQQVIDSLSILEIDGPIKLEDVMSQINFKPNILTLLENNIVSYLKSSKTSYSIGTHDMLYHTEFLNELIVEFIAEQWDNGSHRIKYSFIAEKYGLDNEKIATILQKLVDTNLLENITLYPLDDEITLRV